jgi:hypothetical protein
VTYENALLGVIWITSLYLMLVFCIWGVSKAWAVFNTMHWLSSSYRRNMRVIKMGERAGIREDPFPYDSYGPNWNRNSDFYRGVGGDNPVTDALHPPVPWYDGENMF